MVINEHRCVQAQILVASIVNVGVGAQVRLSLLIFILNLFQASQAIWWESLAVASSRKQLLAVNLNLAGSAGRKIRGGEQFSFSQLGRSCSRHASHRIRIWAGIAVAIVPWAVAAVAEPLLCLQRACISLFGQVLQEAIVRLGRSCSMHASHCFLAWQHPVMLSCNCCGVL